MPALLIIVLAFLAAVPPSVVASSPAPDSFARATQVHYAEQDVEALKALCADTDTRLQDLLCRYRLYPLTEDEQYIESIPDGLEDGSARELALLSGLWAYRVSKASMFKAITYGRRSMNLLGEAREKDALEPYVLLVEGQSLIFRPSIAGRDLDAAAQRFRNLTRVLDNRADVGISKTEAELWLWFSLHKKDSRRADELHAELLASNPPSLYRQFLNDPPRV